MSGVHQSFYSKDLIICPLVIRTRGYPTTTNANYQIYCTLWTNILLTINNSYKLQRWHIKILIYHERICKIFSKTGYPTRCKYRKRSTIPVVISIILYNYNYNNIAKERIKRYFYQLHDITVVSILFVEKWIYCSICQKNFNKGLRLVFNFKNFLNENRWKQS